MKFKLWFLASLAIIATFGVLPQFKVIGAEPIIAQNSPTTGNRYKTYVLPKEFSIQYPSNWLIERIENPPGSTPRQILYVTSRKLESPGSEVFPVDFIKTDIRFEPGSFDAVVKETLRQDRTRLKKQSNLTIGGRSAKRLLLSDRKTNIILTIIRYKKNETIYMASYYSSNNSSALNILQRLHSSFRAI